MNILAFDTSSEACTVALLNNETIFGKTVLNKNTHSANLMPMIDDVLKEAKLDINEVDYIACVVGPGSFTGIRIGVSTAKGLAHALNCKCVPLNSIEAIAMSCSNVKTPICSALDARSKQVYAGVYKVIDKNIETIIDSNALHIDEFINKINILNLDVTFAGIGSNVNKSNIESNIQNKYKLLDINYPTPDGLINLAKLKLQNSVDYKSLMPLYLREPQAVRKMKQENSKA